MAATNEQIVAFIELVAPLAIAEASRRAAAGEGFVLPSVCIAQAAHETGWGTSSRMLASNALFGIKAGGSWQGKVFSADTWEVVEGETHNITANFRAYDSVADSVKDYYDLIANERYREALSTLDAMKTPRETVTIIWSAGYATDPPYVDLIMDLLDGRDLDQYDSKVSTSGGSGGSGGSSGSDNDYTYQPPAIPEATFNVKYFFEKIQ